MSPVDRSDVTMTGLQHTRVVTRVLDKAAMGFLATGIVGGPSVLCFDVLRWLKSGVWLPTTLLAGVQHFGEPQWLSNPTEWIGLSELVRWLLEVPLFVLLPVVCLPLGYFFLRLTEDYAEHRAPATPDDPA